MGRGAWQAAVHGVAKSRTRLSDFTFTCHFHALEQEMATPSSALAWKIPGRGVAKSRAQPTDFTFTFHLFATELDVSCGLVLYTL